MPAALCFFRTAIIAAALLADGVVFAADYQLVSAVVVSRHGVRSPISGHMPLSRIAADPWPAWPVPSGHLTPRGATLATLLGAYYRDYYGALGMFMADHCPRADRLLAWADLDQRTLATANALLDGMFPGCRVAVGSVTDAKVDPLFHPTRAGVCKIDATRARQNVLARAGGNLASLNQTLGPELDVLQSILRCCRPGVCGSAAQSCSLRDVPNELVADDKGHLHLSGPVSIGSVAAEVFLLEYAEGFPENEVAWGRAATPRAIRRVMPLHVAQFDLMDRTPYLASRQGSALVERVLAILREAAGTDGPRAPALALFVGHDTNLANIGGMLGLSWQLPSYLKNETPPAGALHFELWSNRETKTYAVRVQFVAQTLDQMRNSVAVSRSNPPDVALVKFADCTLDEIGACPWSQFAAIANASIDRACVPPQR